ncbi:hypothetical protein MANES_08G077230v8 [Manihot esculenta]|uniref:Uncharacterized protein n=1 Tax=Manihot esculenta TaxID=3983 RepID=A0ACB7HC60_MANES|nr:hypothetical protein MANES_08G077230v8 [Manihot esculenta]
MVELFLPSTLLLHPSNASASSQHLIREIADSTFLPSVLSHFHSVTLVSLLYESFHSSFLILTFSKYDPNILLLILKSLSLNPATKSLVWQYIRVYLIFFLELS